jgi:hypothetical protein
MDITRARLVGGGQGMEMESQEIRESVELLDHSLQGLAAA